MIPDQVRDKPWSAKWELLRRIMLERTELAA
jgi:hypothetical protein